MLNLQDYIHANSYIDKGKTIILKDEPYAKICKFQVNMADDRRFYFALFIANKNDKNFKMNISTFTVTSTFLVTLDYSLNKKEIINILKSGTYLAAGVSLDVPEEKSIFDTPDEKNTLNNTFLIRLTTYTPFIDEFNVPQNIFSGMFLSIISNSAMIKKINGVNIVCIKA